MISVLNYQDNDITHGIVEVKACLRANMEKHNFNEAR
jgi:hypothetical protein